MIKQLFLSLLLVLSSSLAVAADPAIRLERVAGGFDMPVAITNAGDERLFVTNQRGYVSIVEGNGSVRSTPFLDLRSIVQCCGEQGLLSIAFHPRYAENGYLFAYYTIRGGGDVIVARFKRTNDPNRIDPATAVVVMTIDQPFANHNGGQLQFGPDGYLYIATGDGGSAGDPQGNGQNTTSLLGKILRIDIDVEEGRVPAYRIPDSNPTYNTANSRREIWAYGLRNPWRFTFDRLTGDMWIGDVGQNQYEEIDFQPASSTGGLNYGWRRMEGNHCFNPSTGCDPSLYVAPIIEYAHRDGGCSVTGGYVYRGSRFPNMRGLYFYMDYCSGKMWSLRRNDDGSIANSLVLDNDMLVSTFGEDMNGEHYLADHVAGVIYRVTDTTRPNHRRRPVAH